LIVGETVGVDDLATVTESSAQENFFLSFGFAEQFVVLLVDHRQLVFGDESR
jgi:hypothetical protein